LSRGRGGKWLARHASADAHQRDARKRWAPFAFARIHPVVRSIFPVAAATCIRSCRPGRPLARLMLSAFVVKALPALMLHRGIRSGLAGLGALVSYFFATRSSLVHNLGAWDWLAFLFSA
jgi:hypothetical protein